MIEQHPLCYTGCGSAAVYRHHIIEENEDLLACRRDTRDLIDDEETVDRAIQRSPASEPCREHA
ncbi:MAG TPA: hypothetical protein VF698_19705 [Thermoanaerobaculia bacterium]|jgi:hypothetical protein